MATLTEPEQRQIEQAKLPCVVSVEKTRIDEGGASSVLATTRVAPSRAIL